MSKADFYFHDVTSITFLIMQLCSVFSGIYTPKLIAFLIRKHTKYFLCCLVLTGCLALCLTVIAWLTFDKFGYGGWVAQEIFTLYSAGLLIGIVSLKKNT